MGRHMQSHIKASQEKNFLTIVNLQFHDNGVHKYSLYMTHLLHRLTFMFSKTAFGMNLVKPTSFLNVTEKKKMKLMKTDPLKSHWWTTESAQFWRQLNN